MRPPGSDLSALLAAPAIDPADTDDEIADFDVRGRGIEQVHPGGHSACGDRRPWPPHGSPAWSDRCGNFPGATPSPRPGRPP